MILVGLTDIFSGGGMVAYFGFMIIAGGRLFPKRGRRRRAGLLLVLLFSSLSILFAYGNVAYIPLLSWASLGGAVVALVGLVFAWIQ